MAKFYPGDIAYIVESNSKVRIVQVKSSAGGFCVVAFLDIDGEVRLKEDRLFASYEDAEEYLKKSK
ncbi:MAG: hypothetical protein K5927_03945 [Lachnospiraceae bacterium]|nr:hypothetical protein [Lachnospiraceae bacterium]